jgi:rhamnosyltransferase
VPNRSDAESICAVVVTFHPDAALASRLSRIAREVAHVVVVDNGSDETVLAMLRALASRGGVDVILNERNRGIATALNQGIERARALGFASVLLLDQDSVVQPGIAAALCQAVNSHPDPDAVAVVGSNYIEASDGRRLIPATVSARWVRRPTAITSGSLLSIEAFERVGSFRDELFIDEVDHEFCLRALARGYDVIIATEIVMEHAMGDARVERRFLWRTVRPMNYSPARWYFITRNSIVVAREHWRSQPAWVGRNLWGHVKWLAKAVLYEPGRLTKLRFVMRGLRDGVIGKLGPLPEH